MKVIFLDIDGVLNTSETFDKIYRRQCSILDIAIDEFRLEYLKKIIDKTDAKIVLSSSFRRFFYKEKGVIVPGAPKGKKLYDLFLKYGIEIYDITLATLSNREAQIKDWLSIHDDIEDFVIIDDDVSMFYELFDKLVQTNIKKRNYLFMSVNQCVGLCDYHVDDIVDRLNSKQKVLKK